MEDDLTFKGKWMLTSEDLTFSYMGDDPKL
jgi:hypothetical protein